MRFTGSGALPRCSHTASEGANLPTDTIWARAPKARLPGFVARNAQHFARKLPPEQGRSMRVARAAVATHPGRKRRHNEDAYVCEPPLFAIADGMGGARAGEVASGLAAAALQQNDVNGSGEERVIALM